METIKLYLEPCGAPRTCTCAAERNEQGEIVLPDFNACAFTIEAHKKAVERAKGRLALAPPSGGKKEAQP
mgnify:CR=1 FL=1